MTVPDEAHEQALAALTRRLWQAVDDALAKHQSDLNDPKVMREVAEALMKPAPRQERGIVSASWYMAAPTPGPWEVEADADVLGTYRLTNFGHQLFRQRCTDTQAFYLEHEANERAMKALPRVLDEVTALCDDYPDVSQKESQLGGTYFAPASAMVSADRIVRLRSLLDEIVWRSPVDSKQSTQQAP